MIERDFDMAFISDLALREKQIQQNYRPIIAVHKWFARRPGTLFRGLLLSEFAEPPLGKSFYASHSLKGIRVADPFMGGGTPLIEANRLGCDVIGLDINPMAYWIVRQELERLDLARYEFAANKLMDSLRREIGNVYETRCLKCGKPDVPVKYFLWVKVRRCGGCGREIRLFPGYILSENRRHPKTVLVCASCGELTEADDRKHPGKCGHCGEPLKVAGPARGNRCACPECGSVVSCSDPAGGPPRHALFAIEYHCPECKAGHKGRFFKAPDQDDLDRFRHAEKRWKSLTSRFVPEDAIPPGDETGRLHRWGYAKYREMFNARQLLGLELSCRFISAIKDERVRNALATNLSDLLRYQNMLCRYDTTALKSLDIFSVHGFPVGLVQCESNFPGIRNGSNGSDSNVGSGGWSNIVAKYLRAKHYCEKPFEILHKGGRKHVVDMTGEWIGESRSGVAETRHIELICAPSDRVNLAPHSLDGVFTDPPYYGNVQYAELMDFCHVWLRRLLGGSVPEFQAPSTRNPDELTGNENMGRGIAHFTEGLSSVFGKMAEALKGGAPLAFTYHHNHIEAYHPIAVAILDSGLVCSASLSCPAEMGASIHISGTKSSIVDTVFVCRSTGRVPGKWIVKSPAGIASLMRSDLEKLESGIFKATRGDLRCIAFGHLIRLAVWNLRHDWERKLPTENRIDRVARWIEEFGGIAEVERHLDEPLASAPSRREATLHEEQMPFGREQDEIPF